MTVCVGYVISTCSVKLPLVPPSHIEYLFFRLVVTMKKRTVLLVDCKILKQITIGLYYTGTLGLGYGSYCRLTCCWHAHCYSIHCFILCSSTAVTMPINYIIVYSSIPSGQHMVIL